MSLENKSDYNKLIMAIAFRQRKDQQLAPLMTGDNLDVADFSDNVGSPGGSSRVDTPLDVEPAGEVVEIPSDSTPEGPHFANSGKSVVNHPRSMSFNARITKEVANNEPLKAIVVGNAGVTKSRLTYYYVNEQQPIEGISFERLSKQVCVPMVDKASGHIVNKSLNM